MGIFSVGYGTIALLFVTWIILSILVWRFGSGKIFKWITGVFLGILVFSVYMNVHRYRSSRQTTVDEMMTVVENFDSAVGQLQKGNDTGASIQIAAAAGEMDAISKYAKADIGLQNSNNLSHLSETLEGIAQALAKHNQQAVEFVKKADHILDQAKEYPRYPLFLMKPQLIKVLKIVPKDFKIY